MERTIATCLEKCGCGKDEFLDQLAYNEKLAELGRLSAGIIHELNTPLSVIVSAAQMILQERDVSASVMEMVERINLEAQRLAQLTRGVLSFAGNWSPGAQEADVNQAIREVLSFLKYEAQKRSITVIESFDFHVPPLMADPNRLKQIFINLVMNALQAMGNGGYLTIKTSSEAGGEVEVLVSDTGPGIPEAVREHIFDPFFTTKKPQEGTGLGLFVTRKLVESLNGRIRVESSPGRGATFYLRFSSSASE